MQIGSLQRHQSFTPASWKSALEILLSVWPFFSSEFPSRCCCQHFMFFRIANKKSDVCHRLCNCKMVAPQCLHFHQQLKHPVSISHVSSSTDNTEKPRTSSGLWLFSYLSYIYYRFFQHVYWVRFFMETPAKILAVVVVFCHLLMQWAEHSCSLWNTYF